MWDTVWSAVGAVGTVGAVGWAVWTTLAERRKRTEVEQDLAAETKASRDAEKRRQAEHVIGWHQFVALDHAADGAPPFMGSEIRIGNFSNSPIFKVGVTSFKAANDQPFYTESIGVLPPGERLVYDAVIVDDRAVFERANLQDGVRVMVTFRDVASIWWRRWSHNGLLEEIPEEEARWEEAS